MVQVIKLMATFQVNVSKYNFQLMYVLCI